MQLEYLNFFKNAIGKEKDPYKQTRGLSIHQIEAIERYFYPLEPKKQFPKVIRELLFLSGERNPYMDVGVNSYRLEEQTLDLDILLRVQNRFYKWKGFDFVDKYLPYDRIWILDLSDSGSDCTFINLDEESDNPQVYYFDEYIFDVGSEDYISNAVTGSKDTKAKGVLEFIKSQIPEKLLSQTQSSDLEIKTYPKRNTVDLNLKKQRNKFYEICKIGDLARVKNWLRKSKYTDLDFALWLAFYTNQYDIADFLIDSGAKLDVYAVEIVKIGIQRNQVHLVEKYPDLKVVFKANYFFDIAIQSKSVEILNYMLDSGLRLKFEDKILFWHLVAIGDLKLVKRFYHTHPFLELNPLTKDKEIQIVERFVQSTLIANSIPLIEYLLLKNPFLEKYKGRFIAHACEYKRNGITLWAFQQTNIDFSKLKFRSSFKMKFWDMPDELIDACKNYDLLQLIDFNPLMVMLFRYNKSEAIITDVLNRLSYSIEDVKSLINVFLFSSFREIGVANDQVLQRIVTLGLIPEIPEAVQSIKYHWKLNLLLNNRLKFDTYKAFFEFSGTDLMQAYGVNIEWFNWSREELELVRELNQVFYYLNEVQHSKTGKETEIQPKLDKAFNLKIAKLQEAFSQFTICPDEFIFTNELEHCSLKELRIETWDTILLNYGVKLGCNSLYLLNTWVYSDKTIQTFFCQLFKKRQKDVLKFLFKELIGEKIHLGTRRRYDIIKLWDYNEEYTPNVFVKLVIDGKDDETLQYMIHVYPDYSFWENVWDKHVRSNHFSVALCNYFVESSQLSQVLANEILEYFPLRLATNKYTSTLKQLINCINPKLDDWESVVKINELLTQSWINKEFKLAKLLVYFYNKYYRPQIGDALLKTNLSINGFNQLTQTQKHFIEKYKVNVYSNMLNLTYTKYKEVIQVYKKNEEFTSIRFLFIQYRAAHLKHRKAWMYKGKPYLNSFAAIINKQSTVKFGLKLCNMVVLPWQEETIECIIKKSIEIDHVILYTALLDKFWTNAYRPMFVRLIAHLKNEEMTKVILEKNLPLNKNSIRVLLGAIKNNNLVLFDACIHAKVDFLLHREKIVQALIKYGSIQLLNRFLELDSLDSKRGSYLLEFGDNLELFTYLLTQYSFRKKVINRAFLKACALGDVKKVDVLSVQIKVHNIDINLGLLVALAEKRYNMVNILLSEFKGSSYAFYGGLSLYKSELKEMREKTLVEKFNSVVKLLPTSYLMKLMTSKLKQVEKEIQQPLRLFSLRTKNKRIEPFDI